MKCEVCKNRMTLHPIKEITWCDIDKEYQLIKTGEE